MKVIELVVMGPPVAKQRVRVVRPKGVAHVIAYTPDNTTAYMDSIRHAYQQKYGQEMVFDDRKASLVAVIQFFTVQPKTAKRGYPNVRPDLTNYMQSVQDALQGFGFHDDCQIIEIAMEKRYELPPRTQIHIFDKLEMETVAKR